MKGSSFIACVAMVLLSSFPISANAAEAAKPIGRVTAAFGNASADTAAGARPLDLQSLINNDERIITDGGGLTVLLASRVVLKVDVHTAVSVFEGNGQTNISVQYGTVHVYVAQRPANIGPVCVSDPNGCMQTATGVLLAHYDPSIHQSYFACEHSSANAMACNEQKGVTLSADQQAIARDGKWISSGDLDRAEFNQYKLSLDRLGQAQATQGAQTFRLRSRAFDMESAISQLSAAGWIDPRTLPTAGPAVSSSNSSSSSTGSGNSISEVPTGQPKNAKHGGTFTPAPVATPVASTGGTTLTPVSSTPAPIDISNNTPTTPTTPVAPAPVTDPIVQVPVISTPVVQPPDLGLASSDDSRHDGDH